MPLLSGYQHNIADNSTQSVQSVEEKKIDDLDDNTLRLIFKFVEEKRTCAAVCKRWQKLVDADVTQLTFKGVNGDNNPQDCYGIISMGHRWPQVTAIRLFLRWEVIVDGCFTYKKEYLDFDMNSLSSFSNIKDLDISFAKINFIAEDGMHYENFSKIEKLDLSDCSFGPGVLENLAFIKWKSLKDLDVYESTFDETTEKFGIDMAKLLTQCPQLQLFAFLRQLDIAGMEAILNVPLPFLEEFYGMDTKLGAQLGELLAEKAAVSWPRLRILKLAGSYLGDDGLIALCNAQLPLLEELDVDFEATDEDTEFKYSDESLLALQTAITTHWPRLKIIALSQNEDISEELVIKMLANTCYSSLNEFIYIPDISSPAMLSAFASAAREGRLPAYQLLALKMDDDNIDETIELLTAPWPGLEILEVKSYASSSWNSPAVAGALKASKQGGKFPVLKELRLYFNLPPPSILDLISTSWPTLTKLSMHSAFNVEDAEAFATLGPKNLPALKVLKNFKQLDPEVAQVICNAPWPNIEEITSGFPIIYHFRKTKQ